MISIAMLLLPSIVPCVDDEILKRRVEPHAKKAPRSGIKTPLRSGKKERVFFF
jgi:hypothetical protein